LREIRIVWPLLEVAADAVHAFRESISTLDKRAFIPVLTVFLPESSKFRPLARNYDRRDKERLRKSQVLGCRK
jgi:hypothetical protein